MPGDVLGFGSSVSCFSFTRSPLSLAVGDKESMSSSVRKENSVSSFCGKDSEGK